MRTTRRFTVRRMLIGAIGAAAIVILANYLVYLNRPLCELTRQTVCANNVKVLASALYMYQADHGRFPPLGSARFDSWAWEDPLLPYAQGGRGCSECPDRAGLPAGATGYGITGRIRESQLAGDPAAVPLLADCAIPVFEPPRFPKCIRDRAIHKRWTRRHGWDREPVANVAYCDGHMRYLHAWEVEKLKY